MKLYNDNDNLERKSRPEISYKLLDKHVKYTLKIVKEKYSRPRFEKNMKNLSKNEKLLDLISKFRKYFSSQVI